MCVNEAVKQGDICSLFGRLGGPLMAHTDPHYAGDLDGPKMAGLKCEGLQVVQF